MQVIDGVRVHGTRMISTLPAGSRGNDRPITMTRDSWYSPESNLVLSTVSNSPLASGPQIVRVANLSRNAPDPMLFLIPVDYRVVDESKDFEINWQK